ncbi:MAG: phytanoyl-CoA dioxygenase family protein [Rhodospirillaceae bacterium]
MAIVANAEHPETIADIYKRKGYVVVEAVFSADEVARMRAALDELIAAAAGATGHTAMLDLEPSHTPDAPRVRRIKEPVKHHPVFAEMARHPTLIAALQALLGPDLRLHGSKINLKAADYGAPVEWHQDWAFYPHTNDDVLAVGVMLDDMTPDNGPLLVIPGSHTGPTYDHHQDGRFVGAVDVDATDIDTATAEPIYGKAGDCSLHHVRALHASAMNTSAADRRLLLFQVSAADAWDLRGIGSADAWDGYVETIIAGRATNQPRLAAAPVRLPYPGPIREGSIYESQTLLKNKVFGAGGDSD